MLGSIFLACALASSSVSSYPFNVKSSLERRAASDICDDFSLRVGSGNSLCNAALDPNSFSGGSSFIFDATTGILTQVSPLFAPVHRVIADSIAILSNQENLQPGKLAIIFEIDFAAQAVATSGICEGIKAAKKTPQGKSGSLNGTVQHYHHSLQSNKYF